MSRIQRVPKGGARPAQPKVQPRHLDRPVVDQGSDGFLSIASAAQLLDKTPEALRGLIKRGEFPPHVFARRLGRQRRFDKAALVAWMKEGRPTNRVHGKGVSQAHA